MDVETSYYGVSEAGETQTIIALLSIPINGRRTNRAPVPSKWEPTRLPL